MTNRDPWVNAVCRTGVNTVENSCLLAGNSRCWGICRRIQIGGHQMQSAPKIFKRESLVFTRICGVSPYYFFFLFVLFFSFHLITSYMMSLMNI